jgi:hypothetical protein
VIKPNRAVLFGVPRLPSSLRNVRRVKNGTPARRASPARSSARRTSKLGLFKNQREIAMSRTVADVIVETLVNAGARRCYGVPGDTLNYFTDAVRRSGSIRFVHVRHEEVGAFAAGADALLTGELALCAGSCGPGSLHFINGLYENHRNRAPWC